MQLPLSEVRPRGKLSFSTRQETHELRTVPGSFPVASAEQTLTVATSPSRSKKGGVLVVSLVLAVAVVAALGFLSPALSLLGQTCSCPGHYAFGLYFSMGLIHRGTLPTSYDTIVTPTYANGTADSPGGLPLGWLGFGTEVGTGGAIPVSGVCVVGPDGSTVEGTWSGGSNSWWSGTNSPNPSCNSAQPLTAKVAPGSTYLSYNSTVFFYLGAPATSGDAFVIGIDYRGPGSPNWGGSIVRTLT